ncbi:hypothetical protein Tco_1294542 [Tanacetum coccineum]
MTHLLHLQATYKHFKSIFGPQVTLSPPFTSFLSCDTTDAKQHLKPSPSFANSSHSSSTSPFSFYESYNPAPSLNHQVFLASKVVQTPFIHSTSKTFQSFFVISNGVLGRYGVSVPALTKDHREKVSIPVPKRLLTPYQNMIMKYNILEDIKRGPYSKKSPICRIQSLDTPMDEQNMTMEEYLKLEEEKALRHGHVFNWKTATYGKIRVDDDLYDLRSMEAEFPAIIIGDAFTP